LKPTIGFQSGGFGAYTFQWDFSKRLSRRLADIIHKVRQQKNEVKIKSELGFEVDPWDHYLYLDSQYFLPILMTQKPLTPDQQTMLLFFIIRAIENDTIGFFDLSPDDFISKFISFSTSYNPASGESLSTFLGIARGSNNQQSSDALEEMLSVFSDSFFDHCKVEGLLLPSKKDFL